VPHSKETREKMSADRLGKQTSKTKMVIDMSTGIFYVSCSEAYRYSGQKCSYRHFFKMLEGTKKNKSTFVFA
jgi:hypothetical protein